jgi:hypothetical protein
MDLMPSGSFLKDRNSANYFPWETFPPNSMAYLNGKSVDAVIVTVFAPRAEGLPNLTETLKDSASIYM